MQKEIKNLVIQLKSLAKVQNVDVVREELSHLRAEDIAEAFHRLKVEEGLKIIEMLDGSSASTILVELPTEIAKQYFQKINDVVLAEYIEALPISHALEMQEELGDEKFNQILEMIPRETSLEIQRLLHYPKQSVGRHLNDQYLEASPDATMIDILNDIREHPKDDYKTVDVLYVVTEDGHLVGVMSLREVLKAMPTDIARNVMSPDVIAVHPGDSAEEAARTLIKYNFDAVPIVDSMGKLLGTLMADDAHSILDEAHTEDVLKLGAVTGEVEAYVSLNIFQIMKRRVPWLLVLFLAETATGSVLRYYGKSGDDSPKLNPAMFFVPLLIGAGGNSGSQTTTTITRALALGEIAPSDALWVLARELGAALLSGSLLACVGFFHAKFIWGSHIANSLCVALALPSIIIWAAFIGSLLPLTAKRIGIDPAVLCAPFITTFVDSTGLIIYFEIYGRIVGF
jgi:magnesium transporter